MPFNTRPKLDDNFFEQQSGHTLTMYGETDFVGVLKSKGVEINLDSNSAQVGDVLTFKTGNTVGFETPQAISEVNWGDINGSLSAQTDL